MLVSRFVRNWVLTDGNLSGKTGVDLLRMNHLTRLPGTAVPNILTPAQVIFLSWQNLELDVFHVST
jgi:hypothetical protein